MDQPAKNILNNAQKKIVEIFDSIQNGSIKFEDLRKLLTKENKSRTQQLLNFSQNDLNKLEFVLKELNEFIASIWSFFSNVKSNLEGFMPLKLNNNY